MAKKNKGGSQVVEMPAPTPETEAQAAAPEAPAQLEVATEPEQPSQAEEAAAEAIETLNDDPNFSWTAPTVKEEAPVEQLQEPVTVEAVIELQRQLEAKRAQAIKQLLQQRETITSQLVALGYEEEGAGVSRPQRQMRPRAASPASSSEAGSGSDPFCKYCQAHGHDARAHRGQAVKKKFTAQELAALGSK